MNRVPRTVVAHPWLEPTVFVALLMVHIWTVEPHASEAVRLLGLLILTAIPVLSHLLHGERPHELGIRFDNLRRSGSDVAVATLIGSLVVVAVGAAFRWSIRWSADVAIALAGYAVWSFAQQYALQGFVHRRLSASLRRSRPASLVSALLFGAVHFPNPGLMVATTIAGYVWCRLYARTPNLFTLALSHAWLATLFMAQVPDEVHRVMRVGPGYWLRP